MVKIARLEIENVKRVQAVELEPSPSGLTVIGGRNSQGKTSILDAIVWALGGNRHKPSTVKREGAMADPRVQIELDNGIVVKRDGKNGTLKVIDSCGEKAGQALLDELIGQLALNLPAFLHGTAREKAETLLQVIGVGPQLSLFDQQVEKLYNERHAMGQILTRKKKHAEDLPFDSTAPQEEVSASELIQQQQAILAKNGENQRLRGLRDEIASKMRVARDEAEHARARLRELDARVAEYTARLEKASQTAESVEDESTAELEQSLREIDEINQRVRSNATKAQAEAEAAELTESVDTLTEQVESIRRQRQELLANAALPLPGLGIEDGELTLDGKKWDCMSSAEQLRVAVGIVRQLRPDCQFVLVDKLETMDPDTLQEFGAWLMAEGLQVIATRVSTGGECSLIIEDGMVLNQTVSVEPSVPAADDLFSQEGF